MSGSSNHTLENNVRLVEESIGVLQSRRNPACRPMGTVREETENPGEGEIHPRQAQRSPGAVSPDIRRPLPLGRKGMNVSVHLEQNNRDELSFENEYRIRLAVDFYRASACG